MSLAWLMLLAALPLAMYGLLLAEPTRLMSTRDVPARAFRHLTAVLVPAAVDPSVGMLAALSVAWWARKGDTRVAGGVLWMFLAGGLWLGLRAEAWHVRWALYVLLAVGVVEVGLAVIQRFEWPVPYALQHPGMVHGSIGHRTGLAAYLAILLPLGFLTPFGWPLSAIYLVGLAMVPSFAAALGAAAGYLVLFPSTWWMALPVFGVLAGCRAVSREPDGAWNVRYLPEHLGTWARRKAIWWATVHRLRVWPFWLVGYGAGAYRRLAPTWRRLSTGHEVFREAHNDWLEFVFEYGLVGVVALAWWGWRYAPGLAAGDPVTASLVALAVIMAGYFPLRVAPIAALAGFVVVLLMRRVG